LIFIGLLSCDFFGHSRQSLDFQGFGGHPAKLSTKLSTDSLD
jgi:hypothetical protein